MSEIKVNSIKGVAASTAALTINNTDGTCTANLSNRQNRNLIINGAMQVAQRGTSSTTNGYGSVDRFVCTHEGTDEAVTHAQVDVASGTTPYSLGFRKAMKLTNGNQTGGGGGNDNVGISQAIEAQNIANSGWNFKSSSSFITVSFWVKSSVAQNFYGYLYINDGTAQLYSFETGSLTADTWTKIVKKVPGNSNITINNDNGFGMQLQLWTFLGTNYTGTTTLNQWANYSSSTRVPDMTTTWYTTNDSTFEVTGVQIEVGPEATSFEHRSFHQDYLECARYYIQMNRIPVMTNRVAGHVSTTTRLNPVPMRAIPSVSASGTISLNVFFYGDTAPTSTTTPGFQNNGDSGQPYGGDNFILNFSGFSTGTFQTNEMGEVYGATFALSAEL